MVLYKLDGSVTSTGGGGGGVEAREETERRSVGRRLWKIGRERGSLDVGVRVEGVGC